jgi:beta-glucuronidase
VVPHHAGSRHRVRHKGAMAMSLGCGRGVRAVLRWLVVVAALLAPSAAARAADAPAVRVELREGWLYVDGEPFVVKGVGYSPYRPGQSPRTSGIPRDLLAEDLTKIKQAGFNTIRTWKPMSPDQLTLAHEHGLMVLQGVWIDPSGNLGTESYRQAALDIIRREAQRAKGHPAVLALVIGNELDPLRVVQAGLQETESLLRAASQVVKEADPNRLVSYANWPWLSALDHSMWDVVSFNVYPYEPVSVSHTFGYRGYIEHLKRTAGRGKPLIVTELGLSVSPKGGAKPGYGGNSLEQQAQGVVQLWNAAFEAGAQGACVFEWNDEWWKRGEAAGDEQAHDADDAEEWFGITEFDSVAVRGSGSVAEATEPMQAMTPTPRPVFEALRAYNQAVVVSPISGGAYQDKIPVSVYAAEGVASVRARLGKGKWQDAAQVSRHWWRAQVPVPAEDAPRQMRLTVLARNEQGKTLVEHERQVHVGPADPSLAVAISTDRQTYEVGDQPASMQVAITVTRSGAPLPNHPVYLSITEPATKFELTHVKPTDDQGRIELTYPMWDPGLITISAAALPDPTREDHRVGAERVVLVRRPETALRDPSLPHVPSPWELRVPESFRPEIHPAPAFRLYDPGDPFVEYTAYGRFVDAGTSAYRYEITDADGLAKAVGEGIHPNEDSLYRDPAYRYALREDKLKGSVWDFTYHPNPQLAFLRWADSNEEAPGVKQFFTALTLEHAGLYQQAVKAYYAVLVHYPGAIGWTEFKTPWYVGNVAQDRLESLLRLHPELGLRLEGTHITIEHGFDNDIDNDVLVADPGQLVRVLPEAVNPPSIDLSQVPVKREQGKGRITLRQYENGHWQLLVDGKPWVIRGILYQPTAVGESPDEGTLKDWMTADRNGNGKPDGPYDTFVDANENGQQDSDEPTVGDFELMRRMGVNTIRLYHHGSSKELLRDLYDRYGIMVMMGDLVGMYTVGSGATWEEGTDYHDPVQRKRMFESVKQMVREFKKEPYILMWVLGNENNYGGMHGIIGGVGNAAQHPDDYYSFLNELAEWIHKEDPHHPVAIANGEWLFVDLIAKYAPAIDIFGANVYRGTHGFGRSFFGAIREQLDKPVVFTEFGSPAYQAGQPLSVGETGQALYHLGGWIDLEDNMAGRGVGNALGGIAFQWVDEWWKAGQPPRFSPTVQDTIPNWSGPFPGGKNYEEWFGITGQGEGKASPYLRHLRKAYSVYEALWKSQ